MATHSSLLIDVHPTKELFVFMLTRDVQLRPAINDLIDNSVDGAKRLRGTHSFAGLHVTISLSGDDFTIRDNCGGIPLQVAREYAFRFGRPTNVDPIPGSVGRFGVGMKRTLFKLGRHFSVQSTTDSARFSVTVDVDQWLRDPTDWHFKFDAPPETLSDVPPDDRGTVISVAHLYPGVSQEFENQSFEGALRQEIASRQRAMLDRGLEIVLNGVPIAAEPLQMLASTKLKPAFKELKFTKSGEKSVRVKIYTGLQSEESKKVARAKAGWYVFCNGRLLLDADQTAITGWGPSKIPGIPSLPAFHPQYNLFRGFVYFDCADPDRLPWNTTKTGINEDSEIYRNVRPQMVALARPVIDFLNALKLEKERLEESDSDAVGPLQLLLDQATSHSPEDVPTRKVFSVPATEFKKLPPPSGPPVGRIQYTKPVSEIDSLKKYFGVSSYVAVGERSFEEALQNARE